MEYLTFEEPTLKERIKDINKISADMNHLINCNKPMCKECWCIAVVPEDLTVKGENL